MKKETITIRKIRGNICHIREDVVAVEQTFRVIVQPEEAFWVSCTPEHLEEFFTGLLYSRGLIEAAEEIEELKISAVDAEVRITLGEDIRISDRAKGREGYVEIPEKECEMEEVFRLAEEVFEHPGPLFQETGCAHCCALAVNGQILCSYEDIGRHNALDKVLGFMLRNHIDPSTAVVYTSGRISGDYLKKLLRGRIRMVVSRAAVTAEAVSLARQNKIRMLGFVRKGCANDYSLQEGQRKE